jgi:hypothetical protein
MGRQARGNATARPVQGRCGGGRSERVALWVAGAVAPTRTADAVALQGGRRVGAASTAAHWHATSSSRFDFFKRSISDLMFQKLVALCSAFFFVWNRGFTPFPLLKTEIQSFERTDRHNQKENRHLRKDR